MLRPGPPFLASFTRRPEQAPRNLLPLTAIAVRSNLLHIEGDLLLDGLVCMSQDFPFWKLAVAIAVGLLIAVAVLAVVGAVSTHAAIEQMERSQREAAQRVQADRVKRLQAQAAKRAAVQQAAQRREWQAAQRRAEDSEAFERRRARDLVEGEYFPPAADSMKPLTFACKDRVLVRRTESGWQPTVDGNGKPARCRTSP